MHYLLKSNSLYYDVAESSYNSTEKKYDGVPDEGYDITNLLMTSTLQLADLFKEVSINGETFKPIDKFDNFTIISSENVDLKIQGIKTNSELIVMNYDELIDESQIQLIHYFNILGSSNNKVVFSFDSGLSWDTYNNGFIKLDNTVDLNNLNDSDWNLFKNEIINKGVNILGLSSINFNLINFNKIRFAYVIVRDNYESDSMIDNNTLTYDELAHLIKVKSDEMDLRRFTHTVQVTSNYDATYSETRIFLNQKFDPDDNEDNRVILDAPTLEGVKTDNYISLSWNSIENCDYYRLYLNGEIIYQGSDLSYTYSIGERYNYTFAVRAYSNDAVKFKESEFSNIYNVDTYGYLATANNKYVVVQKDGKWYKFLAKR